MASEVLSEVRGVVAKELNSYVNTELRESDLQAISAEQVTFLKEWHSLYKQALSARQAIHHFLESKAAVFDSFGSLAYLLRTLLFQRSLLPEQPKLKDRSHLEPVSVKDGLRSGLEVWYHPNTTQKEKECYWEKGVLQGDEYGWYKTGQVKYLRTRKDGKAEGEEKRWHENGQLSHQFFWRAGKIVGEDKGWYETGQQEYVRYYTEDMKADKEEKRWWPNGQLQLLKRWVEGKEQGEEKLWFEDGKLQCCRTWQMGGKHGVEEIYEYKDKQYKLREKITWVRGERKEEKKAEKQKGNAAAEGAQKQQQGKKGGQQQQKGQKGQQQQGQKKGSNQ